MQRKSNTQTLKIQNEDSITVFHVFTDEKDLWTQDYTFARKLYNHWKKIIGSARLYKKVYEDDEAMVNDEMLDEVCLMGYGYYPLYTILQGGLISLLFSCLS